MEQKLSLSTHILDTNLGKPVENVAVTLFKLENNQWIQSKSVGVTDKDGRLRDFEKVTEDVCGSYKLRFETSEYFNRLGIESFYPFVEITFEITSSQHYHVPLLLSAYGYSTYRGS